MHVIHHIGERNDTLNDANKSGPWRFSTLSDKVVLGKRKSAAPVCKKAINSVNLGADRG